MDSETSVDIHIPFAPNRAVNTNSDAAIITSPLPKDITVACIGSSMEAKKPEILTLYPTMRKDIANILRAFIE